MAGQTITDGVINMGMNKIRWAAGSLLLGTTLAFGISGISTGVNEAWGDDDEHEGGAGFGKKGSRYKEDSVYIKECGSCHLAYPPNLLPKESWQLIMAGLEDHFGENAALDAPMAAHIASYLEAAQPENSRREKPQPVTAQQPGSTVAPAGQLPAESWGDIMKKLEGHIGKDGKVDAEGAKIITRYLDQPLPADQHTRLNGVLKATPVRITELPGFIRKHDEIPKRMVADNPKVGSFSQCDSCHKDAAKGLFDEDRVSIPGFGRWDD